MEEHSLQLLLIEWNTMSHRAQLPMSGLITRRAHQKYTFPEPISEILTLQIKGEIGEYALVCLLSLSVSLWVPCWFSYFENHKECKRKPSTGTSVPEMYKYDWILILMQVLLRNCWTWTILQARAEPKLSYLLTWTPSFLSLKWAY